MQDQASCQIHQENKILGFCISKNCKIYRACCLKCLNEFHYDHAKEVIEQEEVQKLIINNQKDLQSVLYQITELESILAVIKSSYQRLIVCTPFEQQKHNQQFIFT